MTQQQPRTQLIMLLAVIASLTLGFHLLGSKETFAFEWSLTWLDQADPEVALASLLRTVGLVCCYWTLITTLLYGLWQAGGWAQRPIRWMTMPPIRRIVDRALTTTLAISTLAVPAPALGTAEESKPAIVLEIHDDGIPLPHLRLEPEATITSPTDPTLDVATTPSSPTQLPPSVGATPAGVLATAALPGGDNYTVAPGDNLWLIAEAQVRAATAGQPTEQKIATYWRKLIDTNIANLRSGDPNLIYAGEIVTLPRPEMRP